MCSAPSFLRGKYEEDLSRYVMEIIILTWSKLFQSLNWMKRNITLTNVFVCLTFASKIFTGPADRIINNCRGIDYLNQESKSEPCILVASGSGCVLLESCMSRISREFAASQLPRLKATIIHKLPNISISPMYTCNDASGTLLCIASSVSDPFLFSSLSRIS